MLIRELPTEERPRDRLLAHGSETLSDPELLSLLIGSGRQGFSAVDLAREFLRSIGGLGRLVGRSPSELYIPGLGPGKVAAILAALELGRRIARAKVPPGEPLAHPQAVATYLSLRYTLTGQEIMGSLFLDTRNRLLAEGEVFRGTLNRMAVEPKPILKRALLCGAAGLVLFHTHPSGDPSPSAEDLVFTKRLAKASAAVGITLIDHLILGSPSRWISLKERGTW